MGNICPDLFGRSAAPGVATERSSLIANQHQQSTNHQRSGLSSASAAGHQHDPNVPPYTARSIMTTSRTRAESDQNGLAFDKIGLEHLDKRLNDIAALFNNLSERYSNLRTGLLQLEQIGKEICAKSTQQDDDVIGGAFICLAQKIAQAAKSDSPLSVKLKENAKNWLEATFDSRALQYDEISFLNMYNLLGRYAWELRSKAPPLRNTVAMTTQEEETFRRDLLVASLNSAANSFGANFARLRRVDEQLGGFERLGADAGDRLASAGRMLLAAAS